MDAHTDVDTYTRTQMHMQTSVFFLEDRNKDVDAHTDVDTCTRTQMHVQK